MLNALYEENYKDFMRLQQHYMFWLINFVTAQICLSEKCSIEDNCCLKIPEAYTRPLKILHNICFGLIEAFNAIVLGFMDVTD